MNVGILVFPGSNCNQDLKNALESLGVQTRFLWYNNQIEGSFDLLCVPGGFSYGDYLRSGALASRSRVMSELEAANNNGVPILGICNSFQVLTESKLLPGALLKNDNLRHICKDVALIGCGLFGKDTFKDYKLPFPTAKEIITVTKIPYRTWSIMNKSFLNTKIMSMEALSE